MCDKTILENGGTLKSVPDCYKNQEMCNEAVDNYSHVLNWFLNAITLKKGGCCKAVRMFFIFDSIPAQYETQEICDIVVSLYRFS